MDWKLCSTTLKISLQTYLHCNPVHPLDIKRNAAKAVTEGFCLKCNKKNSSVSAGVYASEDDYYSEDYYLGNTCTKDEKWFTS